MELTPTKLKDVCLLTPKVFRDSRGFFVESWNARSFAKAVGRNVGFVQDNHSRSDCGVLRGLHFQSEPMAQAKLITVMRGKIFDVAVDVRRNSPTCGQWVGQMLSDESRDSLWIPEGFAHGFLVLSAQADVLYKTTNFYSPECERCIQWDDADLDIDWPLQGGTPIVSPKDAAGRPWRELQD
jgi:dTDP-4-dehydrorhamnose 3,5-epimerase